MGRKKKLKLDDNSGLLTGSLMSDFLLIDPISFVEQCLIIEGKPFELKDCGRDYLHEIYRYTCLEAPSSKGKPVIIKKGRQVEMTTTASSISLYFACSGIHDHVRGLHVFPQIIQAQRHSKVVFDARVKESKNGCLMKLVDGESSVTHKPFKDGNLVYIEGAGDEGDRLRGISLTYLILDEAQDIPEAARENTLQALSHSKFGPSNTGLEMIFGTPKNTGSYFQTLWEKSDKRYYHLKCPFCGLYQPLWYEYDASKSIRTNFAHSEMVRCEDREGKGCGKLFHKKRGIREGKWVSTVEESQAVFRGYHIDQMLVPETTRESIDQKLQNSTARTFANEIMGNFYAGRDTGLTLAQVIECTTTEPDSRQLRFSVSVQDKMTWAGIDWGARISGEDDDGKGGYTVFVVLSRLKENNFKLEFAERLAQPKISGDNSQLDQIMKWIRIFNCKYVGVDHGFGHVQNQILMEQFSDKIKPIFSTANCKNTYKYDKTSNQIALDKHRGFEEVYDLIEQKAFCFPYAEPIRVQWLMSHISNIEIQTRAMVNGTVQKRYVKQSESQPVDGACALVYAYTAYKFQSTSGFNETISGTSFSGNRNMPLPSGCTMRPIGKTGGFKRLGKRR